MKKTLWWTAALSFALIAVLWVAETPATTDAAALTSSTALAWAPDFGPIGSLQAPKARITEECLYCIGDCIAATGYDATVCRNSYCVVECC